MSSPARRLEIKKEREEEDRLRLEKEAEQDEYFKPLTDKLSELGFDSYQLQLLAEYVALKGKRYE